MRTLVLNQNNLVQNGQNNTLVYNFPNSINFTNSEIAVAQITMYYSWFNIDTRYNNRTLTFNWINGAGVATTHTIFIPDGLYEIVDINNFLQFVFLNGPSLSTSIITPTPATAYYLVNSAGDNVFYLEFIVNPTAYGIQLNTYNFPTALPAGWSNPAAVPFPPQSFNPVVTTPASFNSIVGFSSTFSSAQNLNNASPNPATATAYKIGSTFSYLSTTTPQVQPNSNLLVSISNIDNEFANPSSIIYSLAPSVAIGELITDKPPQFNWNRLLRGTYNQLRLQFLGNDLSPVTIKDPNMTILLCIREKGESS